MGLIVVTGASGHIGANLVRELLARGETVRTVQRDDNPESLVGLDVERVKADVRDFDSMRKAFEGADILYHLAALISIVGPMGGLVREINVEGAANVARAALETKVRRMVHFCSVHAFDQEPLDEPLDETRARVKQGGPAPAYDQSKAAGEAEVRKVVEKGLDAVIVHPSGTIGPWDFAPSRMGQVFLDLFERRLPALVPGGFNWVDARDVVAGAIAAAERGRTDESYLLSGHWKSVAEIATISESFTGSKPPAVTAPMWLARIGAPFLEGFAKVTDREPLYTAESLTALRANRNYDLSKSARELGYRPRPTEESVRDCYTWFAEHGRLPASLLQRMEASAQPHSTT
jgi:dihydroflavonol-4-reductase